jgi:hypothetical protein
VRFLPSQPHEYAVLSARIAIAAVCLGPIPLIIRDYIARRQPVELSFFPRARAVCTYQASATLTGATYDEATETMTGALALWISAREGQRPSGRIETLALTIPEQAGASSQAFIYTTKQYRTFANDVAELAVPIRIHATTENKVINFPFDRYSASPQLAVCASTSVAFDCGRPNVWISSLTIKPDDKFDWSFVSDQGAGHFILQRPAFGRYATIALLVVVAVFFTSLLAAPRHSSSPAEIAAEKRAFFSQSITFLAVLGAFRAFIVPRRVEAFPLAADYVALGVFLIVFLVGMWRVLPLYWPPPEEEKWVD